MSNDAMREAFAAWFAAVTGAAASLEAAAICMRDTDAKKAAKGAAEFYRKKADELWQAALAAPAQSEAKPVEFFAEISSHYPCPVCNAPSAAPAGDGGDSEEGPDKARIQALMLEWINSAPGQDAKAVWDQIDVLLTARHAPAGADALTDDEIVALAAPYCDDSGWMNGDQIFAFARAVFAKRGGA